MLEMASIEVGSDVGSDFDPQHLVQEKGIRRRRLRNASPQCFLKNQENSYAYINSENNTRYG